MRVVLDTNVLVSGLLLPESGPGRIVAAWRGGQFDLVLSEPMLEEVGRVLAYPKIIRRLGWEPDKVARYVSLLRFEAEVAEIGSVAAHVPDDPDDAPILATLVASGADCLVSGDEDLLRLAGEYSILSPGEFTRRLF